MLGNADVLVGLRKISSCFAQRLPVSHAGRALTEFWIDGAARGKGAAPVSGTLVWAQTAEDSLYMGSAINTTFDPRHWLVPQLVKSQDVTSLDWTPQLVKSQDVTSLDWTRGLKGSRTRKRTMKPGRAGEGLGHWCQGTLPRGGNAESVRVPVLTSSTRPPWWREHPAPVRRNRKFHRCCRMVPVRFSRRGAEAQRFIQPRRAAIQMKAKVLIAKGRRGRRRSRGRGTRLKTP